MGEGVGVAVGIGVAVGVGMGVGVGAGTVVAVGDVAADGVPSGDSVLVGMDVDLIVDVKDGGLGLVWLIAASLGPLHDVNNMVLSASSATNHRFIQVEIPSASTEKRRSRRLRDVLHN